MVPSLLRFLFMPALIVGVAWFAAVIYFQQAQREIAEGDILLWFGVVPFVAAVAWVLGRTLLKRINAPLDTAKPGAGDDGPDAVPQSLTLAVLAAEFFTAGGEDLRTLMTGLADNKLHPELDEVLTDGDGHPLRTLKCANLDLDAPRAWVDNWCSTRPETELTALMDRERAARLIALLTGPVERGVAVLATLSEARSAAGLSDARQVCPVVTKVFAPVPWREMLSAYVRERAARMPGLMLGMVRAPDERPSEQPDPQHDALRVADAFCAASGSQYAQSALLIIGCDSLVTEQAVSELDRKRILFSAERRPLGRMPGEAAAVLVAIPAAWVVAEVEPIARLHRAGFALRQKPADARGKVDSSTLESVAARAIEVAGLGSDQVACVVSDCDHRGPWLAEVGQLVSQHLPRLDLMTDHWGLSAALGDLGHASAALSLGVAAALVAEREGPVLALSVDDAHERSCLVLDPWLSSQS